MFTYLLMYVCSEAYLRFISKYQSFVQFVSMSVWLFLTAGASFCSSQCQVLKFVHIGCGGAIFIKFLAALVFSLLEHKFFKALNLWVNDSSFYFPLVGYFSAWCKHWASWGAVGDQRCGHAFSQLAHGSDGFPASCCSGCACAAIAHRPFLRLSYTERSWRVITRGSLLQKLTPENVCYRSNQRQRSLNERRALLAQGSPCSTRSQPLRSRSFLSLWLCAQLFLISSLMSATSYQLTLLCTLCSVLVRSCCAQIAPPAAPSNAAAAARFLKILFPICFREVPPISHFWIRAAAPKPPQAPLQLSVVHFDQELRPQGAPVQPYADALTGDGPFWKLLALEKVFIIFLSCVFD